MKHAAHKGKGPMPPKDMPKTHMMPGGKEMHGEHEVMMAGGPPLKGKPAPKKVVARKKR